ncbi:MAG TPA: hypothetical protein VFI46_04615 [Jiangellaceae bacterium]|nr:hypothetical protein [Jiangellaceae bacterium]
MLESTGLRTKAIDELVERVFRSHRIIVCWAMGITQHKNAVRTVREIVNFLLLLGNMGRPGAGVCPVRGHNNVLGDRTMGDLRKTIGCLAGRNPRRIRRFEPPRHHRYDVVESIVAMRDGYADVFMAVVGNFVSAAPETEVTKAALRRHHLPSRCRRS